MKTTEISPGGQRSMLSDWTKMRQKAEEPVAQESSELDHKAEVEALLHTKSINSYMAQYLLRLNKQSVDEAMWDEALRDARTATEIGVDNDREFNLFFYIDNFVEELVKVIYGKPLNELEQDNLKKFIFGQRDRLKFDNLNDFTKAAKQWFVENKPDFQGFSDKGLEHPKPKTAYKNVGKLYQAMPKYDLDRWSDLVRRVEASMRMGWTREAAVKEASTELQLPERLDFLEWYNFYSGGEAYKYGLNNRIKELSRRPTQAALEEQMSITKIADASDGQFYYLPRFRQERPEEQPVKPKMQFERLYDPDEPDTQVAPSEQVKAINSPTPQEQNAVDFEAARNKLMSRIFAIDKLLEKYKRVLKQEEVEGVEDSLHDLKKKVRKLKMAAVLQDTLYKTAGIWDKFRFDEGADLLRVWAADGQLGQQAGAPPEIQEAMQTPPPEKANVFTEQKKNEKLKEVVGLLYNVSVILKNRNIVRDLAEIDILLDQLKMASFFPEIQDAQAKLIDAFGYASNKVEDVLPKIRGGLALDESQHPAVAPKDQADAVSELHELAKGLDKKQQTQPAQPGQAQQAEQPEEEEDDTLKQLLLPVRK